MSEPPSILDSAVSVVAATAAAKAFKSDDESSKRIVANAVISSGALTSKGSFKSAMFRGAVAGAAVGTSIALINRAVEWNNKSDFYDPYYPEYFGGPAAVISEKAKEAKEKVQAAAEKVGEALGIKSPSPPPKPFMPGYGILTEKNKLGDMWVTDILGHAAENAAVGAGIGLVAKGTQVLRQKVVK